VNASRDARHQIITGTGDYLAVVIGPYSIHDTEAALKYARHLVLRREQLSAVRVTSCW
jgi:3-deoxy-7-phosphoheptulonate synthase